MKRPRPFLQPGFAVEPETCRVCAGDGVVKCETPVSQYGEVAEGSTCIATAFMSKTDKDDDKGVKGDKGAPYRELKR